MKISQVLQNQGMNISGLPDILGKLKTGDVVRAQILDFTANELILKLFDGKTVTAATTAPVDAKRGDIVDFTVKGKNENQVILEPAKNPAMKDNDTDLTLKKLLLAMEVNPEEKNLEIVKEISKYSLPLNKETFKGIADLVAKFKDLTPEKAAFLTSSSINVEEKNIESLNQLISGKAKLSTGIADLAEMLSEISDKDAIKNIVKQLADYNPSRFDLKAETKKDVSINNIIHENSGTEVNHLVEKAAIKLTDSIEKDMAATGAAKQNSNLLMDLKESIIKLVGNEAEFPEKLSSDLQEMIAKKLGQAELPDKIKSNINLIIDKLSQKLKEQPQEQGESVILSDAGNMDEHTPKSILKRVFQKLYVKPESDTVLNDLNVKELYKDISKAVEIVKENIEKSPITNKNEIVSKIDTLDNNIRFINDLNNHNTYIQIPIALRNTKTQGELYILKKESKRKKLDPENVTMFISLDTINIGRVDSLISLDRKNVSVNMRVEDERVFDLIKEKYKDLYEVMKENGYKLVNLNYRMIEETPNVMNVESIAKKEDEKNKRSIDLKL